MRRQDDHGIDLLWAFLGFLAMLTGVVLFLLGESHHSYRLMQWSAVSWLGAFVFTQLAMPSRHDR